jgi:hypothetical protein
MGKKKERFSFFQETVLFHPDGVNRLDFLCGEPMVASAQSFDFLARTKNHLF